jgi:NAD-reducing hydrogenase small subunit
MNAIPPPARPRFATVWLGGCSGCHMSFLDMDERLLEIVAIADLVYSPFLDIKEFPEGVDVTLVEGAVANDDHLKDLRRIRERTIVLVSFGDCAVTGNVTALRNPLGAADRVLRPLYMERPARPRMPHEPGIVPALLDRVRPLHGVVPVDVYIPGCPPHPDLIFDTLTGLIAGRTPGPAGRKTFG